MMETVWKVRRTVSFIPVIDLIGASNDCNAEKLLLVQAFCLMDEAIENKGVICQCMGCKDTDDTDDAAITVKFTIMFKTDAEAMKFINLIRK